MNDENQSFKISFQMHKRENERVSKELDEKRLDNETNSRYIDKERELIKRERESLEITLKDIERKTDYVNRLNSELDDNKKSLNLY